MILTICTLILALALLGKPFESLRERLENANWKEVLHDSWDRIIRFSRKAGRDATRTALLFYYTLRDGELATTEKALLYAGIIYVIVPADFLSRRILGILGVLDDIAVSAWIYKKILDKITPEIRSRTEETLTAWFGPETVYGQVADLGGA